MHAETVTAGQNSSIPCLHHMSSQCDDAVLRQALMERTVIFGAAVGSSGAAPAAGALIARYAGLLAAQVCY